MPPVLELVTDSFLDSPGLDTAVSRALLMRASDGEVPDTLRLHRPGSVVAFGRRDVVSPGYGAAAAAARARGFEAVERLAGGRAAVFHEDTVAYAHIRRGADPWAETTSRFEATAAVVRDALASLGVDARVGEVPGEYCPGEHSVNARGRVKVAGIGQRIVAHASHVGGVVVVAGGDRIRDVLVPVYGALELDWDPTTTGSVAGEVGDVDVDDVIEALAARLGTDYELRPAGVDDETLALARRLAPEHVAPRGARAPAR